ncbi:MAG: uroporphyrin-III C-methyltransferase / precorrin-2 dehydrogenase / sirohydrochlorin ferrochelatase [Frankiales bacterium]|jgi:uroporphyrin-III C-methyltransferase/precorrin-2 dehydrogenase/sirohydrochlorin ferrochelatase|nr:uroporphyrin-III C-methyltransferase / precorrin-2 dehydrogenase / sirohydrochlorin ferrochelatase [Frankiales bacterium]
MTANPSYPLLLRIEGKPVLVVGAGPVAARRAAALVAAGADVLVVAPVIGADVRRLADDGALQVAERPYNLGDLDGVWLVHACTDQPAVNAAVAADADADRVFCVRADDREASAAWVPAVHRQGDVVVAVNAGGAPARARALRDQIAEALVSGSQPEPRTTRAAEPTGALGVVHLVGAGPGDPGLLTLRARDVLREADVVLLDRLVDRAILAHLRPEALVIDVGKRGWATKAGQQQDQIERLMIEHARAGRRVVRLKGGDPFVFGRGGEEALACAAAGIPFDVVPGVSSAIAVPAYAGIPVTHRGITHDVAVLSGHLDPDDPASQIRWRAHAQSAGTLVVLMGLSTLGEVCATLIRYGRSPTTPAASIARGTTVTQRVVVSDLEGLAAAVEDAHLPSPVVTVIGDVVRLRERMRWYAGEVEAKP